MNQTIAPDIGNSGLEVMDTGGRTQTILSHNYGL